MRWLLLTALLLLSSFSFAGSVTGVFQGTVVQMGAPPARSSQPGPKNVTRWMYIQGKNGSIRRANIARAVVAYDDDYPRSKRHKRAEDSLLMSCEVRVTAEQDESKDGEWQATNVDIVSPPKADRRTHPKSGATIAKKQD